MSGSVCVVVCTLVAFGVSEPIFGFGRETPEFSIFSSSSGVACLNGGTSVRALTSGEHMFCLCSEGFEGQRCETARDLDCYEGLGLFYRGTASTSASGLRCVPWDPHSRSTFMSADVHQGRHNYCRNLHYRRRPWCNVWKNQQLHWEYCDIPLCQSQAIAAAPSTPAPSDSPSAAVASCGLRSTRKHWKIVGGSVATIESHPWVAAIYWRGRSKEKTFRCGGSLIDACWVLTAAHCFPDGSDRKPRRFSVTLGKNALNQSDAALEQTFRVEKIILHESFDSKDGTFDNDIALMKLKPKQGRCAQESHAAKSVCLPPPLQTLLPGTACEIAGYGKEAHGLWYRSQFLREAQVQLFSQDVCRRDDHYGALITENMLCAGRPDWSQDACEGDSGGPLVCEVADRLFLFGLVSWGDGCAEERRPGVYTRVSRYNEWLEEKTGLSAVAAGSMFPLK